MPRRRVDFCVRSPERAHSAFFARRNVSRRVADSATNVAFARSSAARLSRFAFSADAASRTAACHASAKEAQQPTVRGGARGGQRGRGGGHVGKGVWVSTMAVWVAEGTRVPAGAGASIKSGTGHKATREGGVTDRAARLWVDQLRYREQRATAVAWRLGPKQRHSPLDPSATADRPPSPPPWPCGRPLSASAPAPSARGPASPPPCQTVEQGGGRPSESERASERAEEAEEGPAGAQVWGDQVRGGGGAGRGASLGRPSQRRRRGRPGAQVRPHLAHRCCACLSASRRAASSWRRSSSASYREAYVRCGHHAGRRVGAQGRIGERPSPAAAGHTGRGCASRSERAALSRGGDGSLRARGARVPPGASRPAAGETPACQSGRAAAAATPRRPRPSRAARGPLDPPPPARDASPPPPNPSFWSRATRRCRPRSGRASSPALARVARPSPPPPCCTWRTTAHSARPAAPCRCPPPSSPAPFAAARAAAFVRPARSRAAGAAS
eukprot:7387030-Prymnesium_polylepis.1